MSLLFFIASIPRVTWRFSPGVEAPGSFSMIQLVQTPQIILLPALRIWEEIHFQISLHIPYVLL